MALPRATLSRYPAPLPLAGGGGQRGPVVGVGGNRGPSRALVEAKGAGLFLLRGAGKPRLRVLAGSAGEAALPGTGLPGSVFRVAELPYWPASEETRPEPIGLDAPE